MIEGKSVLAITLARGGSKRVFKKNIALINNKPLLTSREIFFSDSSTDHDVPPLNETHPNGFSVGQSHNNVQPYRVSYVWKRVQ